MEESPIGTPMTESGSEAQRRGERDSLLVLARIRIDGAPGDGETVRVRNVSSGGLMAQSTAAYAIGASVVVELDGIGAVRGSVAWSEAGRIGIAFDHPVDKARARKPKTEKGTGPTAPVPPSFVGDYRRPPLKPR